MTVVASDSHAAVRRLFIVDDHPMIREGLCAQIAHEPSLEVCGHAEDVVDALAAVPDAQPDLVIVDISLKSGNGIDLVKRLKAKYPHLVILVWSMYPESLYAERALRAGARGFVNKSMSAADIMDAIHSVLDGKTYLSAEIAKKILGSVIGRSVAEASTPLTEKLTDRELQAFELLGQGMTTQQIATRMHVSHKTIETYRARIKEKLGLTNAVELVQHAVQWVMGRAQAN